MCACMCACVCGTKSLAGPPTLWQGHPGVLCRANLTVEIMYEVAVEILYEVAVEILKLQFRNFHSWMDKADTKL